MNDFVHLISVSFLALFPICNPLGNAAVFLSLTEGRGERDRRRMARKGVIYMFGLLVTFLLGGTFIMNFFGFTLDGVRIAGGIVVARVGFRLLHPGTDDEYSNEEKDEARQKADISFSPLALPLLSGPGAFGVVMGLSANIEGPNWSHYVAMTIGIFAVCFICWVMLRYSSKLKEVLGVNGINAMTRIMGFLLLCIAVQFIIDGVLEAFGFTSGVKI